MEHAGRNGWSIQKTISSTPIIRGKRVARSSEEKANMARATYAGVTRVLVGRDKQKSAHQTVRKWLKETSVDHDIQDFTLAELEAVLKETRNSTWGEDGVSPLMLKTYHRMGN